MTSRAAKRRGATLGDAPAEQRQGAPWFLMLLLAVYVALAATYNSVVAFRSGALATALIQQHKLPVNPDEAAHVENAYRYKAGTIPVFRAGDPDFEAHQPPLYYALIAPLLEPRSASSAAPVESARWLSILFGAGLLAFVWLAIREAFPESRVIADTAACLCLLPTNVNVCASISNDVLTNLVVAASGWQLARTIRSFGSPLALARQSLALGALLAVGLYTKTSTLVLFPAVLVAAALMARRGMVTPSGGLRMVGISWGIGLILAAPWLLRNTRLYGDPLAQHVFNTAFTSTTMTMSKMLTQVTPTGYVQLVGQWTFDSFWAVFDGMRLFLPAPVYGALSLLTIAQVVGTMRWVRSVQLDSAQIVSVAALGTVAVGTVLAFARFNEQFFQAQGRYLYPGLTCFGLIFAVGTLGWFWRAKSPDDPALPASAKIVPYASAALLLILNLYSLYTLHQTFPPLPITSL